MKNYLLSLCLLFGFYLNAQTIVIPDVKIKKENVLINKINVSKEWKTADFIKALGSPERAKDGYNKTHTYDVYGVVLFEFNNENKEPSGFINEVQFYFSAPEPNLVTPKGVYSKNIKVDKLVVSANLTPAKMKKALKKWTTTESYLENSYRMQYGKTYVYFQFDKTETKLIKISIGVKKS